MPSLTVTEKTHWKDRIAKRLDKKIEALLAGEPNLLDRIQAQARQRAVQSLCLAEMQTELDALTRQQEELERREQHLHRAMLAVVRRVPVDAVDGCCCHHGQHHEVSSAVQKRLTVHEEELLAEDALGQAILRLRREKDNLLDVVWLASSPQQIKDLWKKVVELLGEEQTTLQKEALAIGAVETA